MLIAPDGSGKEMPSAAFELDLHKFHGGPSFEPGLREALARVKKDTRRREGLVLRVAMLGKDDRWTQRESPWGDFWEIF